VTVIKQERPKKKATAHICTDSDCGLVTIYCDLSEQFMMPCEVIHFFFPSWISAGFFSERVVLRLVTTSLFFVISYVAGHGYLIKSYNCAGCIVITYFLCNIKSPSFIPSTSEFD
jgi:hypothetical protein